MTDESQCDILTCLRFRLTEFHSTEYSWHNLRGTVLDSLDKAAVLVPLVITDDNHVEVWLTQRSENVRHDKGHVSFPGGMKEPGDASAVQTSLREASEEIGLRPDQVTFIIHS